MWSCSIGGHIVAGSNIKEAIIKEAKEELGLMVNKKDLIYVFPRKHEIKKENYLNKEFQEIYLIKEKR